MKLDKRLQPQETENLLLQDVGLGEVLVYFGAAKYYQGNGF